MSRNERREKERLARQLTADRMFEQNLSPIMRELISKGWTSREYMTLAKVPYSKRNLGL